MATRQDISHDFKHVTRVIRPSPTNFFFWGGGLNPRMALNVTWSCLCKFMRTTVVKALINNVKLKGVVPSPPHYPVPLMCILKKDHSKFLYDWVIISQQYTKHPPSKDYWSVISRPLLTDTSFHAAFPTSQNFSSTARVIHMKGF